MLPRPGLKLPLLLLACLGVYLVGNQSVPLWDRDEPRFAQTSRQMLQSGDWVVPRLYDHVRTAKPPLIYWMQAASMKLIGREGSAGVFAARLPSSIAMILTLSVLAIVLWRYASPGHAVWTVLILGTCALVVMAAKTGLTDSVLLLFVTIAQLCLYAAWRGHGTWGVTVVMAIAIALALLTKGPVAVGIQAMTLIGLGLLKPTLRWTGVKQPVQGFEPVFSGGDATTLSFSARHPERSEGSPVSDKGETLRYAQGDGLAPSNSDEAVHEDGKRRAALVKFFAGILIVLAIGLPWVRLVEGQPRIVGWTAEKAGIALPKVGFVGGRYPGFISTAFSHEIVDRTASGLEGHKGPPGYYLAAIWPTFMPWSLVLPLALVTGWKNRRDPRVRFALAAIAGPWLMFEIVQTKLPHYLLPCFPPLAFLAADAIQRVFRGTAENRITAAAEGANPMKGRGFKVAAIAWGAVMVSLGSLPWAAAKWFTPLPMATMALMSLYAMAYAMAVALFFHRDRPAAGLVTMGVGMLGFSLLLFGLYLPAVPFLQLSKRAGQALRDHGVTQPKQVIMLDYKEPSLAFYQGGTIREEPAMVATDKLVDVSPPWLVMTDDVYNAAATDRARLEIVARFEGLDLSAGLRVIHVMLVKKK